MSPSPRKQAYDAIRHVLGVWPVVESERTYFMRRAAQERSAADRASDGTARRVHLELEQRYRERVGIVTSAMFNDRTAA